ncbi:hypothetical protein [Abyssogena phaseoliformis symbiont]|uniref:hypothetical protein n=1 Tax=Abyssogena phaseoliformis symbiont TaxID=596095 RepID=UPI001CEC4B91|nr:hypothetical protein [Abyssogena phaseoliformis symbiont]MBW5289454.1 putative baseplate assembly protein V [Candidatus Ruthia sp. Apha_13_S6]
MTQVGKISQIKNNAQSTACADVCGRLTPFLPVLQIANSFKKHWTPLRAGEQVLVLDEAFVIRGIFCHDLSEPSGASADIDITEHEDGTCIEYSVASKTMTINAVNTVNVNVTIINVSGLGDDVVVNGISLVNHTHPKNSGNHFGGNANTSKPN